MFIDLINRVLEGIRWRRPVGCAVRIVWFGVLAVAYAAAGVLGWMVRIAWWCVVWGVCGLGLRGLGLWLGAWAFVGLGHGLGLCVRHGTGRRYLCDGAAFGLLCCR
jgi:hypothetical protein